LEPERSHQAGFESARFHSLLKKSSRGGVLKGHGFIRATEPHKSCVALAAGGWFSGTSNLIFPYFSELFSRTESA